MKSFLFLVICAVIFETFGYEINVPNTRNFNNNDTLLFAQVIYRHGARNIDKIYPNDPFKDESHWPDGGIGQLTTQGKQQQYKLGKFLRQRYNKLLGANYSVNRAIYVQSTDIDRTINSALVNLAGFFYPTDGERWNEDIAWQPVPVHTVPKKFDNVLLAYADCPKYKALYDEYMKQSAEVNRIYTEYADLFPFLSEKCGANITTITDVYWLYNTLDIERYQNKSLPEWAANAIERGGVMEYIATFDYETYTDTPQLARLKSGFLLKEILEHFSQKINLTLQPNRSLWVYSAHDITITNMLNALGLYKVINSVIPPYASSLHFELFKTGENEHYVQLFYRMSEDEELLAPLCIPQCGLKCSLDELYRIYNAIIPGDFISECQI